ncbi:hypothetical protein [Cellvibrio sp. OA-2007]|uniref:hypothetical protein n=1 Tax=Cellvibrio sp. OA-2007 TaxID=529823 RepID=UPI000783A815|nr:hypothetical protein [Cellvibrio sp. OA-2007]
MRIDSKIGYYGKRVCISIDDDLLAAFGKFAKKPDERLREFFRKKIYQGEIKNSNDAKLFIYSQMMKPSAFKCFAGAVPDQVDIEDV